MESRFCAGIFFEPLGRSFPSPAVSKLSVRLVGSQKIDKRSGGLRGSKTAKREVLFRDTHPLHHKKSISLFLFLFLPSTSQEKTNPPSLVPPHPRTTPSTGKKAYLPQPNKTNSLTKVSSQSNIFMSNATNAKVKNKQHTLGYWATTKSLLRGGHRTKMRHFLFSRMQDPPRKRSCNQ